MMRKPITAMAVGFALAGPAAGLAQAPAAAPPAPPAIIVIGASYVAKQLCSCVFVAGRAEAPCRAEFRPQIDPFAVTVGPAKVTASLGPETAEADFDPAYGCVLAR